MTLPSTAPCCSSSDTFDVLQSAPSGQLRGGGSSKISPMSASLPGGTGVQNQLSSRATASAPLTMLLPSNKGAFAGQGPPWAP
eukprot:scaffold72994_cov48-Phaeocystis_antarctica.AAC.1